MHIKLTFSVFALCIIYTDAWKNCEQVQFCKRLRKIASSNFSLVPLTVTSNTVHGNLKNKDSAASGLVTISALENGLFRLQVDDAVPSKPPRHTATQALDGTPKLTTASTSEKNQNRIVMKNGKTKALIHTNPFKIEIYAGDQIMSVINANQRLRFEKSVALDVQFPGVQVAYGIPLHADHLALRTTTDPDTDPYRLFNVDYFAYQVNSTEALYGSVPVLYAHGTTHTSGIFWLNSAQTWVDVEASPKYINAYFMSETGVIDTFILPGPTLPDAVKQYAKLTGTSPLPPYFSLAYHQSRYSYMSEDEVKDVVKQFSLNRMPLDVLWLDVDYTLKKKYFTWNPVTFPDPIGLQNYLLASGKKLVAIIDPHIKNETGYFVNDGAVKNGYYVRNPDGTNYVGECWPGPSSYLDLTNQNALDYYANLYETVDTFQSKGIHIWNDMNEPSVFYTIPAEIEEYEKTMPLDRLHFDNYEHRDVHNLYGFLQTVGTRKGMLARRNNTVRPFILTRSHFAGSQRYAAIWTGDNYASWEHLKISISMCLTEALAGISFCGADVGGFTGIPSDELYQRWYQAGTWLSFFRGHSEINVPRREPYRFSDEVKKRVLTTLQLRYAHLPYWYTLFYEHERTGEPVIRPISYHYPKEVDALRIDNQFLVGSDILAAPVLTEGANTSRIYLPGGPNEIWYNIDEKFAPHRGGYHTLNVNLDSVPVFYRGGAIIPRKDTPRMSSVETHNDPFTIYIAPDIHGSAKGRLYVDDYESFAYKKLGQYVYSDLAFSKNKITYVVNTANYKATASISHLVIINPPKMYVRAKLQRDGVQLDVSHGLNNEGLIIRNCSLNLHESFEIVLS